MRLRRAVAAMSMSLVAVLSLAACGGSDSTATPEPPPGDQEKEYFTSVRAARSLTTQNFEGFQTLFGRTWPVRSALISALEEAGVGEAFDGTVEALGVITPPQNIEADHQVLLAGTRDLAQLDKRAADAVKADDLISFALINGQMASASHVLLGRLSPAYCSSLSEPGESPSPACQPGDPLPGGSYGAELHEVLGAVPPAIGLASSATAFAFSLTPEEIAEVVQKEIPQVIETLEKTKERIELLTPTTSACSSSTKS